jgi:Family of unknown function (DUF5772)
MKKNLLALLTFLIEHTRPKDWSISGTDTFMHDGLHKIITFFYNGKKYKYIGDEITKKVRSGFFLPIQKATWNGEDVTDMIRAYAGPRQDFFGSEPRLDIIFHKCIKVLWIPVPKVTQTGDGIRIGVEFRRIRMIKPLEGTFILTNILGQHSVFGAK